MTAVDLSKSQVKAAGKRLRKFASLTREERRALDLAQVNAVSDAYDTLVAWRRLHAKPLNAAQMGLRSACKSEHCEAEISQRLKRIPTIMDKLQREPTLSLERMQDIGGVRAVLPTINDVRAVQARYHRRANRPVRTSDYIAEPRDSGYRGLHLIVEYHGHPIEIQLRTAVMHEWAVTVERISGRLKANLKGDGVHPVQLLLAKISEAMALEETGMQVDGALLDEIADLRANAAPFLRG